MGCGLSKEKLQVQDTLVAAQNAKNIALSQPPKDHAIQKSALDNPPAPDEKEIDFLGTPAIMIREATVKLNNVDHESKWREVGAQDLDSIPWYCSR